LSLLVDTQHIKAHPHELEIKKFRRYI